MVADSKPTNNEELLQLAIKAAKNGQTDGARVMLRQVLSRDKRNERAMMWLAKLSRSSKERREWLTKIVQINPQNEAAKNALSHIKNKHAARENRTLVMFGAVAVVMVVVVAAVFLIVTVA